VLDVCGGNALLLAENIVENRSYNKRFINVTWENCTLRQYLNDEFYKAFSNQEQARILEAQNTNADNQWFGAGGGNDTIDKIFLLSIEQVVRYFGDSGQLKNRPQKDSWWIEDTFNSERVAKYKSTARRWWLRSPGYHKSCAAYVYDVGNLSMNGYLVGYEDYGVRPALWLSLK
jgi:hypothetical protein